MKVLVTGGAGYIGTHISVELLELGHQVVVIDNLSNSSKYALSKVSEITGKELAENGLSQSPNNSFVFYEADIRDRDKLRAIFDQNQIDAVIHLAGLKAVGESTEKPLEYYDNNVVGSIILFEEMADANIKRIIFSSSATVYGNPESVPIREEFPIGGVTNPYGRSKLIIEEVLQDIIKADSEWKIGLLRYFNPVGAHVSGEIGEDSRGVPNNIMPYISQVAVGKLDIFSVFGKDYPTKDGTGVRDYIHVVDLSKGHVSALNYLTHSSEENNLLIVNLGTGQGYSVLEMINAFETVSSKNVPFQIIERRAGDVAECYADPSYAEEILGWKAEYDLQRMCEDTWRWQQKNPNGFIANRKVCTDE